MLYAVRFILTILTCLLKVIRPGGTRALVAENIALKQQLMLARRKQKRSPNLTTIERCLFGFLTGLITRKRLSKIAVLISPATLLKFHKALVKRKYRLLFSNKTIKKPGPKGPNQKLIALILEIKQRNPRFGYLRITMQINNQFGLSIDKGVVRRVLDQHYKSPLGGGGPSWLSFIGHSIDSLWSVDLFRCESILLKSYWVMVVMDQFSRRIIGFASHQGDLNGIAVCMMFNKISSKQTLPKYLSSDHDPLFTFHRWKANLRILEIEEIKSVPYEPKSHPFIERMIGTIRREYLNHIFFWNKHDLNNKLKSYQEYYNAQRAHSGIHQKTPQQQLKTSPAKIANLNNYRWTSHARDLFQLPITV